MYIESRIPTGVSCFVCRLFRREHLYDHLSRIYCSLYIAFAILCTCVLKLLSTVFSALSKRVLVKFRELFFFFFLNKKSEHILCFYFLLLICLYFTSCLILFVFLTLTQSSIQLEPWQITPSYVWMTLWGFQKCCFGSFRIIVT